MLGTNQYDANTTRDQNQYQSRNYSSCIRPSITNSTENSPLKANISSVGHEFPRILLNPKVNYGDHKGPPHVSTQRQINLVHVLPTDFL
jgi:hypothetical protein